MKKTLFGTGLILALAVSAFAQDGKFKKDPNQVENKEAGASGNSQEPVREPDDSMDNLNFESGTNLEAKLLSTLDAKKAAVGDEVVLETTKSVKQDGEVILPRGSKLIGRITEVKRKSKDDKSSRIGIVFEQLQNEAFTVPVSASIVSIANAASSLSAGDLFSSDMSGSSRTSTRTSGSSSGGGGLLGGATGAVGGVLNSTAGTVGGVTNTVGSTARGTAGTLVRTVDGIQIMQSGSASAGGTSTLSMENKNLRLNKGTRFQLQLNESVGQ